MTDETDEENGVKTEREAAMVAEFAKLVAEVGGSTKAGRIVGRPRGTIEQWAAGRRRLPFEPVVTLVMHLGGSLDRFAFGGDDDLHTAPSAPSAASDTASPAAGPLIEGPPPEGYVALPLLDVTASAGDGAIAPDHKVDGLIAARESWLRMIGAHPTRTEALVARGDSMEPTIRDGDLLLVDRSVDRIMDDAVYVVTVCGAVKVKRVTRRTDGSVILSSDNPRHPPETVPASEVNDVLTIEGRVRWCGRLM